MALFGFGKKKKSKDLPDLDLAEPSLDDKPLEPTAPAELPPIQPQPIQQQPLPPSGVEDGTKLILAKLDTINAQLENLNHRIANLEKIATASQEPTKPWYTKK